MLTQRELDTNARWLRDVLGGVDVAPVAKGLHAFGNVTTGLKSGNSTTTFKSASKVGVEEGGSSLKQVDSFLRERAQHATKLVGSIIENLLLNMAGKVDTTYTNEKIVGENLGSRLRPAGAYDVPVENNQWLEKKTV